MNQPICGRERRKRPARSTCGNIPRRDDTAAREYVWAAVRGFLFGYLFVPGLFFFILTPFYWNGVFTNEVVGAIMRAIFFSPMQFLFLILAAYFAIGSAISASEMVRRTAGAMSWYEFFTAITQRR
jgi:hypothetical protein